MARHLARITTWKTIALEDAAEAEERRVTYAKHRAGWLFASSQATFANTMARNRYLNATRKAIRHYGVGRRARDER